MSRLVEIIEQSATFDEGIKLGRMSGGEQEDRSGHGARRADLLSDAV
jgi:hypothetical protein